MKPRHLVGFVALAACNGFGSTNDGTPVVDAGTMIRPDAGSPDSGVIASPDAGCVLTTATAMIDADTELAGCNSTSFTNGAKMFANIGVSNFSLFRFKFEALDAAALAAAGSIQGGTLELSAYPNCNPGCGLTAQPTVAGKVEAHLARSDWDEGGGASAVDGADECRRTTGGPGIGLPWGSDPKVAWGSSTIIASPADYDATSSSMLVDNGASEATIPLNGFPSSKIDAQGRVSFFLEMPTGGHIVVATKELGLGAATLSVTYCK